MPFLTMPLALLGLASIPVLAGIYILRNRYRRQVVSSLMLFEHLSQAREGGTRVQKLQLPLLFLLELAALAMLALAAAGPMATISGLRAPLVVVLDDSFSMLASDGKQTARDRGVEAVADELGSGRYAARMIVAGDRPRRIGEPITSAGEARRLLERWRCGSTAADLDAAIALAGEVGGLDARIMVVTDYKPPVEPGVGRVKWVAVGRKSPNVGFVAATRSDDPIADEALLEIANLSDKPARPVLTVESLDDAGRATPIRTVAVELDAHQTRAILQPLSAGVGTIRARLGDDALAADNAVTLVRPQRRPVRVRIDVGDQRAAELVRRAVEAFPDAVQSTGESDLLITGGAPPQVPPRTWVLHLSQEPDAVPYVGPFVVDRTHPLADGLSLAGVIWSAGATADLPGRAVVTAGNIVLVSDADRPGGGRDLYLRCRLDTSTLVQTPNWPVLTWNLLAWRASGLPGLDRQNIGVNEPVAMTVPPGVQSVRVTPPTGEPFTVPVESDGAVLSLDRPGEYRVRAGSGAWRVAANTASIGESNLADATTGSWGEWPIVTGVDHAETPMAWLAAIVAMAMLTMHLYLVGGRGMREAALGESDTPPSQGAAA